MSSGQGFGEIALVHRRPRNATIRSKKCCHFATLDKHDFDTTILKIQKKKLNKIVNFLSEIPCFARWSKT